MSTLPPIREPFPVKVPFKTAVDLYKLGKPLNGFDENTAFLFDQAYPAMLTEKLAVFQAHPEHVLLYLKDDLDALQTIYWQTAAVIAHEHPTRFTCDERGMRSRLTGCGITRDGDVIFDDDEVPYPELGEQIAAYLSTLNDDADRLSAALALSVQEDVVVMRHTQSADAHGDEAEALLVALPTHWDPLEKLGQDFGTIHVPVGDNERLLRAHPRLMRAMIEQGPFVRYNWSLSSVPQLAQNPVLGAGHTLADNRLRHLDTPAAILDALFFRSERQTLLNYPDQRRAVFLIRIYQRPLRDALQTAEQATRLADAIASMTDAHRAYRSMIDLADPLIAALREVAAQKTNGS